MERFGARALRLAGASSVLLGWRPADFWGATPAELEAAVAALMPADPKADTHDLKRLQEMFPDG